MPYIPFGCNCPCCSDATLRQLAFICNALFAMYATAIIISAIIYWSHFLKYKEILPQDNYLLPYLPQLGMSLGILYFISEIIVLQGISKTRYSSSNILLIIGCVIGWISLFLTNLYALYHIIVTAMKGITSEVKATLISTFRNYHLDDHSHQLVHQLQQDFSCCGIMGPKFWHGDYPKSCYPRKNVQAEYFRKGCQFPISDWLKHSLGIVIYIYVGSHILQIISLISAGCLSERMFVNKLKIMAEDIIEVEEDDDGYMSDDEASS